MINFTEFLNTIQASAIENKLLPNEDYVWRRLAREYSRTFFTPLHLVMEMDPETVVTHVFENRLENFDLEEGMEELLDIIRNIEDPDYNIKKEQALREEDKRMLEEEKERLERGDPIHASLGKSTQKNTSVKTMEPFINLPKGGSVDLSHLTDGEKEGQF